MQEAIPYKSWLPIRPLNHQSIPNLNKTFSSSTNPSHNLISRGSKPEDLKELVSENAVIVFCRRGCCMSHVVKRLLQGLGVNPPVKEVDEEDEEEVMKELEKIGKTDSAAKEGVERVLFPAVFVGGKFFGGLDRIMATHITGELAPILKQAGALWL